MKALILFLSLTSTSVFAQADRPKIIYIEGRIEKEIQWPIMIVPVEGRDETAPPKLKVHLSLPPLLKLSSSDKKYQIHRVENKTRSSSPDGLGSDKVLTFETYHRTTLIKLDKLENGAQTKSIVLKVTFPGSSYLIVSSKCLRAYDLVSYEPTPESSPLLVQVECEQSHLKSLKTSPESFFPGSRQFADFNRLILTENHLRNSKSQSVILPQILNLTLSEKKDVIEKFEKPTANRLFSQKKSSHSIAEKLVDIHSFGFFLSNKDPELFGSLDLKSLEWRNYVRLDLRTTVPYLLTGHSRRSPVDAKLSLSLARSLVTTPWGSRLSAGVGAETLKIAPKNLDSSLYAWGPKILISADKIYRVSHRKHLSLSFSTSALSHEGLRNKKLDHITEGELRLTSIQTGGELVEPRLNYEVVRFHSGHQSELLKVGMGVRF